MGLFVPLVAFHYLPCFARAHSMRACSWLLVGILLQCALFVQAAPQLKDARIGTLSDLVARKSCRTSDACKSGHFCNHGSCASKKKIGASCYKNNGCVSGVCASGSCVGTLGSSCSKSTQCQSGLCEYSKCATKHANGQACYKNVACVSGYCKNLKICAAATSSTPTSTTSTFSSTSTSTSTSTATPSPTPSGTSLVSDPGFNDGLTGYSTSGSVAAANNANKARSGSAYVAASFSPSTSSSASVTKNVASSSSKRATGTYYASIWYAVRGDYTAATAPTGGSCTVSLQLSGTTFATATVGMGDINGGYSQLATTQDVSLTSFGFTASCTGGVTAEVDFDDLDVVQTSAPPATSGTQIVTNPSFEDGLTGYKMDPTDGTGITVVTNAAKAHSGSKYITLSTNGSSSDVYQNTTAASSTSSTIKTTISIYWRLDSFYTPAGGSCALRLIDAQKGLAAQDESFTSSTPTGSWNQLSGTITGPTDLIVAMWSCQGGSSYAAATLSLDDLSASQVQPSS